MVLVNKLNYNHPTYTMEYILGTIGTILIAVIGYFLSKRDSSIDKLFDANEAKDDKILSKLDTVTDKISTMSERMGKVESYSKTNSQKLATFEKKIETLESIVNTLQTEVALLKQKQ